VFYILLFISSLRFIFEVNVNSMKAIIYNNRAEAKRIKVFIPYKRHDFRKQVKG